MKVLTDIWYSRRQRIHQLLDENDEVIFTSQKITELLIKAIDLDADKITFYPDKPEGTCIVLYIGTTRHYLSDEIPQIKKISTD